MESRGNDLSMNVSITTLHQYTLYSSETQQPASYPILPKERQKYTVTHPSNTRGQRLVQFVLSW